VGDHGGHGKELLPVPDKLDKLVKHGVPVALSPAPGSQKELMQFDPFSSAHRQDHPHQFIFMVDLHGIIGKKPAIEAVDGVLQLLDEIITLESYRIDFEFHTSRKGKIGDLRQLLQVFIFYRFKDQPLLGFPVLSVSLNIKMIEVSVFFFKIKLGHECPALFGAEIKDLREKDYFGKVLFYLFQSMLKNGLKGSDLGITLLQVKEMDHAYTVIHMIDDDTHGIPVIKEHKPLFTGIMQIRENIVDLIPDGISIFILEKCAIIFNKIIQFPFEFG